MPAVLREDPYAGYNFEVLINGVSDDGTAVRGSFAEVSGLETSIDPSSTETAPKTSPLASSRAGGGRRPHAQARADRRPSVLELGRRSAKRPGSAHRGFSAAAQQKQREVLRWNFRRGWPCKWTGSGLNAKNNEIAMETLEICHEGLSIDGQAG